MTDRPDNPGHEPDAPSSTDGPPDGAPLTDGPPPRLSTFSLEGRSVPALYLIGWVAGGAGLIGVVISLLGGGSPGAPWLFLAGLVLLGIGLVAAAGSQAVERGRRTDLAYRGPSPVLAFLAVVPITLLLIVVVVAPLSWLGLDARSPIATTISLLLTTLVYAGVVRLLVVGPGALSWRDMGLGQPIPAAVKELAIGALFALPVLLVTLVLGGLLTRFVPPPPSPLPPSTDALALIANLVSAAILAPIGEELFFRGFSTTAWARSRGAGSAIVRGAVFFALAHVVTQLDATFAEGAQRALYSFLALLPVAVALGWLFLGRRSLYASIGLHATFNGIQVLVLFALASGGLAQ